MIIYRVTNLQTGRLYIGAASCDMEARWKQHLSAAKSGRKGAFYDDIRALGPLEFGLTKVVSAIRSRKALRAAEQAAIIHYGATDPVRGYNTSRGGEGIRRRRKKRREPTPTASE